MDYRVISRWTFIGILMMVNFPTKTAGAEEILAHERSIWLTYKFRVRHHKIVTWQENPFFWLWLWMPVISFCTFSFYKGFERPKKSVYRDVAG